MEIKSSLLNDKYFDELRKSLIEISKIDGKQDFRVRMLEYINDTADNNEDMFFYEMLEFVRFLDPSNSAVAYTDEDGLIYLNSPGKIGEIIRQWDFIYCHECLHQLWDTFGVRDKIVKEGHSYNHNILNVASDCVINDYLSYYRKKPHPDDLITPEFLKEKFDVQYDRVYDTQYSLYLKLLEHQKEIENDPTCQKSFDGKIKPKSVSKDGNSGGGGGLSEKHSKDYIDGWTNAIQDTLDKNVDPLDENRKPSNTGNAEYDKGYEDCMDKIKQGMENGVTMSSSGGGGAGGGSDLPQIPWDTENDNASDGNNSDDNKSDDNKSNDNKSDDNNSGNVTDSTNGESAKDAAERAQNAADKLKNAAESAERNSDENAGELKKAAKRAQEAADKSKEASDAADDAENNGNKKEVERQTKIAKEEADKASKEAKIIDKGTDNSIKDKNSKSGKSSGEDTGEPDKTPTDTDLEELRKRHKDVIERYRNKISGVFGEFLDKCRSSVTLNSSGLGTETTKGKGTSWNNKFTSNITSFVKGRVNKVRQQYTRSYNRMKRGSGYVGPGGIIQPGKKIKENKLNISTAFYIDHSGSMGGSIDNVFDACYSLAEALKKQFGRNNFVDKISFRVFPFNHKIKEIEFGKRIGDSGSTCSFGEIINFILENTKECLINVIITDAGFSNTTDDIVALLKEIDGLILFITNQESDEIKKLANMSQFKSKLVYILADNDFTI